MKHLKSIVRFLTDIGFVVEESSRSSEGFLPGILVYGMHLYIGPELSPGDLLHEAGHIAIVPKMFRSFLKGDVEGSLDKYANEYIKTHFNPNCDEDPIIRGLLQCGEAEAIAWSYAAAIAAGIPPTSVFHSAAYDGEGESIIFALSMSAHPGINGLQAANMTTVKMFPKMKKWLQD